MGRVLMADEMDSRLADLAKVPVWDAIQLNGSLYAVVSLPKTVCGTRAYTYALVDLETGKVDHSFCQFEDYSDMLLNLCLHHKLGKEDEMLWGAVCCLIEGRKKSSIS